MKTWMMLIAIVLLLSGCASTGTQQTKVDRITPEELAKILPQPVATVTLDEIVADSKAGKTADEIIAKIKTSHSRYELTPTQTLDLNKQGVDVKVLDYIHQSNELAKQNAIADEMNKREQEKSATKKQLQRERALNNRYYDPFWGPHFGAYYGRGFYPIPIGPAGRHWRGSRLGWGLGYGYPYGW
jgi:PBP1b-binding outer membrane lipoprotein LpoB